MATRTGGSALIVALAMEFLAVGVFTVVAGTDDRVGSVVLIFVVGLFLLFLVTNDKVVSGLADAITLLAKNPGNA